MNIRDMIMDASQNIKKLEEMASKTLMQPFASMNSSSRKTMYSSQLDQNMSLVNPEIPLIQTGYEDEFGRHSSPFVVSDDKYQIITKIPKYRDNQTISYVLLLKSMTRNFYTIIEREVGHHNTETYGYLYNNTVIDQFEQGHLIYPNMVIKKSTGYKDDTHNRMDGVNLETFYCTIFDTIEDAIVISETASKKLAAPIFKKVEVYINDNDIPLNLYGDSEVYKTFPNIGEDIQNGLLCGIRREIKDESLFSLAYNRLSEVSISDEKFPMNGKVVDINVYCNNPDSLYASPYTNQIAKYYEDSMHFSNEIVANLEYIATSPSVESSYDLKKLYFKHKRLIEGAKFADGSKTFSNTIIEFLIINIQDAIIGDKLTDRYGGKGVISQVVPDNLMPRTEDGDYMEIIFNSLGPPRRENPGQLIEVSLNFINKQILEYCYDSETSDDFLDLLIEYLEVVLPKQASYFKNILKYTGITEEDKQMFINSLLDGLILSAEPLSDTIDIVKLEEIYTKFQFISQKKLLVPMKKADGTYRFIPTRRKLTYGKKYIYRLEQYAEEKTSATSLSGTNIKNEPVKSKSGNRHKETIPKTPIRFGDMEHSNMSHFLNIFAVVESLMIHSTSTKGRRLSEELLTGDPYNVDIKLTSPDQTNRNVEVLNTFLKTMGLEIVFEKIKRPVITPMLISPMIIDGEPYYEPMKLDLFEPMKVDTKYFDPVNRQVVPMLVQPMVIVERIAPINMEGWDND